MADYILENAEYDEFGNREVFFNDVDFYIDEFKITSAWADNNNIFTLYWDNMSVWWYNTIDVSDEEKGMIFLDYDF